MTPRLTLADDPDYTAEHAGREPFRPQGSRHMGIEERRAREFRRREQDILAAALALAGGEDWPAVTIDHIADKAEIGKGTVYKHFKSKDEVCARLVMDDGKELLAELEAIDPQMEFVPRLKQVLKTFWRHHMRRNELFQLRMYCELSPHSLNLSEGFAREFWSVRDAVVNHVRKVVQEGIERGIVPNQRIDYLMSAGWSTLAGAMRLVNEHNFPTLNADPDYLDYLVDYILKGLMNAQAPVRPG